MQKKSDIQRCDPPTPSFRTPPYCGQGWGVHSWGQQTLSEEERCLLGLSQQMRSRCSMLIEPKWLSRGCLSQSVPEDPGHPSPVRGSSSCIAKPSTSSHPRSWIQKATRIPADFQTQGLGPESICFSPAGFHCGLGLCWMISPAPRLVSGILFLINYGIEAAGTFTFFCQPLFEGALEEEIASS